MADGGVGGGCWTSQRTLSVDIIAILFAKLVRIQDPLTRNSGSYLVSLSLMFAVLCLRGQTFRGGVRNLWFALRLIMSS